MDEGQQAAGGRSGFTDRNGMPAVSLAAMPGRRRATIELGAEIERRGFAGIYGPSLQDALSLMVALALRTEHIALGTTISPLYTRPPLDYAQTAAFIHEVSGGRFRFGVGVSHEPAMARLGIRPGRSPLADTRAFVEAYREAPRTGEKPPIILATLRRRMIALAGEIADGMVFANAARSHMPASLEALPPARRADPGFFIGNMVPTCISDDVRAAREVNRRTLTGYALLPNYRNYWREAGYEEEMDAVEAAAARQDREGVARALSDRWLADTTLFGTPAQVREGIEAWHESGVRTLILVPSSASGNQMRAFEELFDAFS